MWNGFTSEALRTVGEDLDLPGHQNICNEM